MILPAGPPPPTIYCVDPRGLILSVGGHWERFAAENGAPRLTADAVVGRRLREFIADATTRHLYDLLIARVRTGATVRIPFRCDGPTIRRRMHLRMTAGGDGSVRFDAELDAQDLRAAQPALDASIPHDAGQLTMCGWCKRVPVGTGWLELEDAASRLELLTAGHPPRISHGICPACRTSVLALLD